MYSVFALRSVQNTRSEHVGDQKHYNSLLKVMLSYIMLPFYEHRCTKIQTHTHTHTSGNTQSVLCENIQIKVDCCFKHTRFFTTMYRMLFTICVWEILDFAVWWLHSIAFP